MSTQTTTGGNGIGAGTLLAIVFTVLKLTHVIAWSWWWVLSPVWIPVALFLVILFAIVVPLAFVGAVRR
jgi:hypothetical protein